MTQTADKADRVEELATMIAGLVDRRREDRRMLAILRNVERKLSEVTDGLLFQVDTMQRCPACGQEWLGKGIERCDCGAVSEKAFSCECCLSSEDRVAASGLTHKGGPVF